MQYSRLVAKIDRLPMSPDELKKRYDLKRRALIFFGGTPSFLLLVSIIPSGDDSSSSGRSSGQSDTTQKAQTTQPATADAKLSAAVRKEAGKSNIDNYGDRIQYIEWTEEQTLIRLLGDENLSSGLTKSSNRRLVLDAIEAYQSAGLASESIAIDIYFPLVDNLGNEKLYRVLGYGFTQERIMAINPGNIDTKRMDANFADEFTFVHPAFQW